MRSFALWALVAALSSGTVTPRPGEFRMTAEDVFAVTDRGVFITGIVEGGPVSVRDVVCLRPGAGEMRELTIQEIAVSGRPVDTAEPGMAVRLEGLGPCRAIGNPASHSRWRWAAWVAQGPANAAERSWSHLATATSRPG